MANTAHKNFTEEQKEWIISNSTLPITLVALIDLFEEQFGFRFSESTYYDLRKKLGFEYRNRHIARPSNRKHSEEQIEWLNANTSSFVNWIDVVNEFNSIFNTNITVRAVCRLRNRGVIKVSPTRPHRYGNKAKNSCPVGTIKVRKATKNAEERAYIKIKEQPLGKAVQRSGLDRPYWIPLKEKMFLDYGGVLNEGDTIIFLNKNHRDFSKENLYAIPMKIHRMMSFKKLFNENREITLANIAYCKLVQAMIEIEGTSKRHIRLRNARGETNE